MEDFKVDITLDSGPHARSVTIPLPPFTLIGATTRLGLITGPMRSRFGLPLHLEFYEAEALQEILRINAHQLKLTAHAESIVEIAGGRAGRRAWPTGCCGACVTTPASSTTARSPWRSPETLCSWRD